MDGYFAISIPSDPDILLYSTANTTFRGNRALSGGAVTLMRNTQVGLPGGVNEGSCITHGI